MNKKRQILSIAKPVRKWCEYIYNKAFFQLEQKSVLWIRVSDLSGFCAIASYVLFLELQDEFPGLNPKFCYDDEHCWIRASNYIVDVTAKQFNDKAPEILVCKRIPKGIFHWVPMSAVSDKKSIRKLLKEWKGKGNPFIFFSKYIKYPTKQELYGKSNDS